MIWNEDNFFKEMDKLKFVEDGIKSSMHSTMSDYCPTHFFVYKDLAPNSTEVENIDLVFCTEDGIYNFYMILAENEVIIDYDWSYGINIKILEEQGLYE